MAWAAYSWLGLASCLFPSHREEAEGLFACLEVNEALTPGAQASRPSVPSFTATACSPGALDESNFPLLGKVQGSVKVIANHSVHQIDFIARQPALRLSAASPVQSHFIGNACLISPQRSHRTLFRLHTSPPNVTGLDL